MTKAELKTLSQDQLVTLSQEMGRERDRLRDQQIAVADEIRARHAAIAKTRVHLQAQMDALAGDAVAQGADFKVGIDA